MKPKARPAWLDRLRARRTARWQAWRALELNMERMGFVIPPEQVCNMRPGAVFYVDRLTIRR